MNEPMTLIDVYSGRAKWEDYLESSRARASSMNDLREDELARGIERLRSDFDVAQGELVWKSEMTSEAVGKLLEEIRLAEFEREARAYRIRAERAYVNGWYEEALADFLEAEKRNYPDYSVHRSIATLYLYHFGDLPAALSSFEKAAKYSRPSDSRQCSESHYFLGVVSALMNQNDNAISYFLEASLINPNLVDAHYQCAVIAAISRNAALTIQQLERAVRGDSRYLDRAGVEPVFDAMRSEIDELFERLIKPIEEKAEQVRKEIEALKTFVIARPDETSIQTLLSDLETQMSRSAHASNALGFLEKLAHAESEIGELQRRFHRQYSIDPREYIRSVAFSPDGALLAAGFMNGRVQVWQSDSGQSTYSTSVHLASVNSVAFSPDNFWLASGSRDRTIKLLEAETGLEVRVLSGHLGEVRSVSFSPDGQWLTSGSHDKTVRLWRVATGGLVETFAGHAQQVTSAIFSPEGRTIASASWDRTVRLWDVTSERPVRTLARHSHGVGALAFSADGLVLASGDENGHVMLWDTRSGRMTKEFRGHINAINSLAFSPDGRVLASGCLGRSIILWAIDSGEIIKRVRYKNISYHSVAFSPRGEWLALGSRGLELWLKALLTHEEYDRVGKYLSKQITNAKESQLKEGK